MISMFGICSTILVLIHYVSVSCGFNLLTENTTFIRHADINNQSTRSSYFGYDFAISVDSDVHPPTSKFLIGSPKYAFNGSASTNGIPHSPGNIYSCPASTLEDGISCTSSSPVKDDKNAITDRDALGMSVIKSATGDPVEDVMGCAPLRLLNCSTSFLSQGTCYGSENMGETWQETSKEASAVCPTENIDLIFVLDGSGSVNKDDPHNFVRVKTWVKDVTSKFDINGPARVGVIQYSHWYRNRDPDKQQYMQTEVALGQFKSLPLFRRAVDNIEIQGYTTYTAHAINKTVSDFHSSDRFNDTSTKKVMILLTDGRSNDKKELPRTADYAREQGITTIAIGVGDYSKSELKMIAGSNDRIYTLKNFTELNKIVDSLQTSIAGLLEGSNSNQTTELQHAQTGISGFIGRVSILEG